MGAPLPYSDFRLQYLPDKGVLWVRGWLLFLDGPADRLACRMPGIDPVEVDRSEWPQMKEAFPHIPDAEMSGIEMHVPAPDLEPGHTIELTLMAVRDGKVVAEVPIAYRRPEADFLLPSSELAQRVSGSRCLDTFLSSGNVHTNAVARMLQPHIDLTKVQSFLDWGCGCGRISLHLGRMLPHAKT